ncbi:hypothetical protein AYI87_19460 [Shewanella sp. KCT]|nr:hypothetical protein AYI87_19460 [Shewanella sp. KCT]
MVIRSIDCAANPDEEVNTRSDVSIDEVILFKDKYIRRTPVCLGAYLSKALARQTDKDQLAKTIFPGRLNGP